MYCEYLSFGLLPLLESLVGLSFRREDMRLSRSFSDAWSADFVLGCWDAHLVNFLLLTFPFVSEPNDRLEGRLQVLCNCMYCRW